MIDCYNTRKKKKKVKKGEDLLLETKEGGEQTQDISGKHRVV